MRYECINIDVDKLSRIIKSRGLTDRLFSVIMWGKGTHRTIKDFERRPNTTIGTAMKVCNVLDISLDELFSGSDKDGQSPYVVGNQNVVNSAVFSNDPTTLRSEIKSLKTLVKEKDARIEDLKRTNQELNNRVDFLLDMMKKNS